jgi:hypothetical protein
MTKTENTTEFIVEQQVQTDSGQQVESIRVAAINEDAAKIKATQYRGGQSLKVAVAPPPPAVTKARTGDNRWGYDRVDDLTRIAEGYARCRTTKHFIATEAALAALPCKCAGCGEPVTGKDNRGEYRPKTKGFRVFHYECAWNRTLNEIAKVRL